MRIEIVCTDRGRHPGQRVGFILEVLSRQPSGVGCAMMRNPAGVGTGYRLRCAECGRAPEVTLNRWPRLVAGLDALRAGRLDISRLPF